MYLEIKGNHRWNGGILNFIIKARKKDIHRKLFFRKNLFIILGIMIKNEDKV